MSDTPAAASLLAKKLQVKPESRVLCLPDPTHLAMVGELPAVADGPDDADVVLVTVAAPEEVEEFLDTYAEVLAGARVVWLLYPKGGAAPVNRDTIWAQVVAHGWRLVSNVAVDDRWSALRTRPLRPGENVATPS